MGDALSVPFIVSWVVLTVLLALKRISSVHNISNDAIRIFKLRLDTDRFVVWQSIHS